MRLRSIIIAAISILSLGIQPLKSQEVTQPFLEFIYHPWVDSVFRSLTPDERIGQLIWIEAGQGNDIAQTVRMSDIIRNKRAGGVIFSGGEPGVIAEMVNFLQNISPVPLFIIQKNDKKRF